MILIDTSVWVRARSGRYSAVAEKLAKLVRADEALGHDLVFMELLLGEGGKTRERLLTEYRRMRGAPSVSHGDAVAFVHEHDLAHKGIGAVDVHILASAVGVGAKLWTTDERLRKAAARLRLEYDPESGS